MQQLDDILVQMEALLHFKKFSGLKESTARIFKKLNQEELKKARSQKGSRTKVIKAKKRGRALLLGGRNTRSHDRAVNTAIAIVVYDALVERHPEQGLNLFDCMGFVRRAGMTRKVEIPAGAKKKVELTFSHEIVNYTW